ncbi:MAG: LacI family DNA-binding transcriptional regulator [Micropruina sp.]|uniref:LacI family DNA-binding transcriptional regulator n=1 Tax=Micropruina sp. TaxID=2737536 RepID=UPI0039E5E11A
MADLAPEPARPGSRRAPTLQQVAAAAGVSRSTAARSLGNYGTVDPVLRERVLEAARELGYRRNALASSVSSGRSSTVGVVISDIEDPHFARAVRGIIDAAGARGFDVILANTDEKLEAERSAVKVFLDKRVDGFIVTPSSGMVSTHLDEILQMPRPLVLIDRFLPGLDCDWVGADDYTSTYAVIERLAGEGHRRIDLVAATSRSAIEIEQGISQPISPIAKRIQALRDAAAACGVRYRLHTGAMSRDRTRQVVRAALDLPDPPTALLASYSEIALTAFQELRQRGLSVPGQLSLVSLDDAEWMTVSSPTISAVQRPSYAMGVRATEVLLARLAGDGPAVRQHTLPNRIVDRESIGTSSTMAGPSGRKGIR